MVSRSRVLLGLLLGCKASDLGVDVPRGGVQSVSQEDLQRDTWAIVQAGATRTPGTPAWIQAREAVGVRLRQMHLLPGFGQDYLSPVPDGPTCAQKSGRSDRATLIAAEDPGLGASGAAAGAALISFAKAYDVMTTPEHTLLLCYWSGEAGRAAFVREPAWPLDRLAQILILGPLAGEVQESADTIGGRPAIRLSGAPPSGGDTLDLLDFRRLEALVRTYAPKQAAP